MPLPTAKEVWLALRDDAVIGPVIKAVPAQNGFPARDIRVAGTGTLKDPYDVSSPRAFSDVMNYCCPENAIVHFGPGIFLTYGYNPQYVAESWQVKSGQRFIGAGVNATTIKVIARPSKWLTSAFTHNPHDANPPDPDLSGKFINGFEAMDFTIDCNMRAHDADPREGSNLNLGVGAVALIGTRIHIRRVRAIDFGTFGGEIDVALECFVIFANAHPSFPDTYDCVIEDCWTDLPSSNGAYNTSSLGAGGGEVFPGGSQSFARHCVLRHNLVNFEYENKPVAVAAITYSGNTATVFTRTPHGRRAGDWVVITGALVDQMGTDNPFNGSFQISEIVTAQSFRFTLQATAAAEPTGEMWIGRRPNHLVGVRPNRLFADLYNPSGPSGEDPITVEANTPSAGKWTVTVRTQTPHLRVPGNGAALNYVTQGFKPSAYLNRLLVVSEVANPNKLKLVTSSNPGAPDSDQTTFSAPFLSPGSVGLGVDGGIGGLAHNNRVFGAWTGYYHDTHPTKDCTVKKNLFHACQSGIVHNLQDQGEVSYKARAGSALVLKRGSPNKAVFTTQEPHGLTEGASIDVHGALTFIGGASYTNPFNRTGVAIHRLSDTQFEYELLSNPQENASGSPIFLPTLQSPTNAQSLKRDPLDSTKAVFETAAAHSFAVDDFVSVFGATAPDALGNATVLNPYNGAFQIIAVTNTSPFTFTYRMTGNPGADAGGTPQCARAVATPLVNSGQIATYTTLNRHTLTKGQAIVIGAADDLRLADDGITIVHQPTGGTDFYEGPFEIIAVPSVNTIQFKMRGTPSKGAFSRAVAYSLWQVERFIVERNIIDQILNPLKIPRALTIEGIDLRGSHNGFSFDPPVIDPFIFPLSIIRRNVVQKVDRKTDDAGTLVSRALVALNCKMAIVERNLSGVDYIESVVAKPVTLYSEHCGSFRVFGNQVPNGTLLQAFDRSPLGPLPPDGPRKNQFRNNLDTDADLAAVLNL